MKVQWIHFSWLAAATLAFSGAANAQAPPAGPPLEFHLSGGPMEFGRFEMGLSGKTVTGAPYSAQIVHQRSQTLSDGTHIAQQSSGAVYRDSAGRVRREMSLPALGSLTESGQAPHAVFINDPVTGYHYVLHAESKAADRMPLPPAGSAGKFGLEPGTGNVFYRTGPPAGGPGGRGPHELRDGAQVTTESLGTQTIEGVVAEGTRTTKTIPVGAIGNDRAIQIVTERWYSADLQTVVLMKRSDPWMGDSTLRLTTITHAEPDASLFAVPSDYTVTDRPAPHAFGPRGGVPPPPKE